MALSRKLARELREGTYQPSSIGKKAREVGTRAALASQIDFYKDALNSGKPKYNKARSDKATRIGKDGKPRSAKTLRKILDFYIAVVEGDDSYIPEEELENDRSWFYYQ